MKRPVKYQEVLSRLPYRDPFLFVDQLLAIDEESVEGAFRFPEDAFYYQGHFKDHPVTPGVILTECMAQVGVVSLGIYLALKSPELLQEPKIALSSSQVDFFLPVYPGQEVRVRSRREYFRFNKLKCAVDMFNEKQQLVCRGTIAGMLHK